MPRLCKRSSAALAGLCGVLLALCVLTTSTAHAYDDQASLDLAAGYVHVSEKAPLPPSGGELTVGGGYGLGDMFVLRGSLGYGLQRAKTSLASVGRGRVELAYLIDVLSVVPFFGLGASAWLFDTGRLEVAPAGHVLVGADLLITREWNVGLDVRMGLLLHATDTFDVFEGQLRLSRLFDLLDLR